MSIDVNVQNDLVIVTESSEDITVNVSNAAGPAGVGVPTGGSAGQVLKKLSGTNYDTYWALDGGGVPYSGATGDVNLGEFGLSAGQLTLDTSPTGTAAVGTTRWNNTIGSSETTLKGGSVILKNGVDLVARVVNKVSPNTTLTKAAYQAVKVSGAQGQRLAIALAQANNDANSADTIGLVTETIATNQEGFIMTVGNLEGINTTGSLQGETWADGDVLYLSPTTAGRLTNIKPTGATGHIVVIGYVEYSHVNNGKIYVKIMNGWELDELHNVYISSVANNDALIYESSTSLWKNKTIATALGYTPVPTTRTLTINGTAYDLSADRSWTVSGSATPAGSNTQIQYNNSGVFGASANLVWDNANTRLRVNGNIGINATASAWSGGFKVIEMQGGASIASFTATPSAQILTNLYNDGLGLVRISATFGTRYYQLSGQHVFEVTGSGSAGSSATMNTAMTLTNAGRLLLGTVVEGTYLLDINGTARVSGSLVSGANNSFLCFDGGGTTTRYGIGVSTDTLAIFSAKNLLIGTAQDANTLTKSNCLMWTDNLENNLIIGQSTSISSNYKLQVVGRSIFRSNTTNPPLVIDNPTTSATLKTNSDISQYNAHTFSSNNVDYGAILGCGSSFSFGTFSANEMNLMSYGNGHVTLRVNNVGDVNIKAKNSDANNSSIQFKCFGASGNIQLQDGGTYTDIASAKLAINSSTQGFLPPRMTTTQKNAIGTPAAGLQVYDTTLNQMSYYNGTTWVNF